MTVAKYRYEVLEHISQIGDESEAWSLSRVRLWRHAAYFLLLPLS